MICLPTHLTEDDVDHLELEHLAIEFPWILNPESQMYWA